MKLLCLTSIVETTPAPATETPLEEQAPPKEEEAKEVKPADVAETKQRRRRDAVPDRKPYFCTVLKKGGRSVCSVGYSNNKQQKKINSSSNPKTKTPIWID